MAPRKKPVSKKPASKKKRRGGHRGLIILGVMALVVAGVFLAGKLMKPEVERPVQAELLARIGSQGLAPGQIDGPRGIASDLQGNVYVTDLGNARINKYAPDGKFLQVFGKRGDDSGKNKPGEFREPSGVAVDKDGFVYVADAWNGRIQKFDPKGTFVAEFGGATYAFYSPRNVALDASGRFYVADTGNSSIKAFNAAGKLVKEMGGRGKSAGKFNEVFGIAIDSKGAIYAADPGNRRITKFSALPDGKFLKEKKVRGWQESPPFWPHLAVDAADHIYAADSAGHKVWVYDSELNYLGTILTASGKELFSAPIGVAVGSGGELFVADMGANQVVRLGNIILPPKR
ncbi:MAG: NHL repeat-containing protein [candidate division FCPU426 bacterium]